MKKSIVLLSLLLFCSILIFNSCKKFPPEASFTCDETSGEFPLRVNFTSTCLGEISSFLWEFGDGGTAETQNAQHIYVNAGSYTARLTVEGPDGEDSSEKTITVTSPAPVSGFTCDKTSGTAPLTVKFTSSSTGSITSYSWDFGDGGTSNSQNPSHTYSSAGTYTAKLTVTGPGGSDSNTKTITVSSPAPVANFTCNRTTGEAPLIVYFTSSSTGSITSYAWTFGDGGTSSSQNPSHTYNSAGTYTSRLTVTGPGGSDSKTKTITVSANPGTNVILYNNTHTEVNVTLNSSTKTIAVGSSVTYNAVQGSSVYYSAYTYGKTDAGGTQIGGRMEWSGTLSLTGGTNSWNLNVGSDYFFIYMRNSSTHTLSNLYVNYELASQTVDYITISNSGTTDPLGYYKAWTNSNVRIYWQDNMSVFYYWNYNTHFTLPWTDNQSVSLVASSKSGKSGADEKLSVEISGTSELPKQPYIYRSDPTAVDLYCK